MTVPSAVNKVVFAGDDVSTVFAVPYYFLADEDLTVIKVTIATSAESTLVLDTDYTVAGEGDPAGGTVTLTDPLLDEYNLIIRREVELTQGTDFKEGEGQPAETLEECLDRLTMMCQQLQEQIDRDILINLPTLIPGYLYSDGSTMTWTGLTATNYSGTISRGADASKAVAPAAGDIYVATDTLKVYVCYSAGTWSNLVSIHDLAAKTSLTDNDVLVLEDSAASYALKKITRANLKTDITDACVKVTGNQSVAGIKTFGSFPVTPSSAPSNNYDVANKKYVDDMNSAAVGYNASSNANVDNSGYKTVASVAITTVAGKKVLINGYFRITPHATVDITTIYLELYRDTTQVVQLTAKSEGADSSAYNIP
ncbi:MAG: hypothetical protein WC481_08445, partial [Candidatus Omnitrophota bacterium]